MRNVVSVPPGESRKKNSLFFWYNFQDGGLSGSLIVIQSSLFCVHSVLNYSMLCNVSLVIVMFSDCVEISDEDR